MTEVISSPEEPKFTREQVVDAFRKFPTIGITNPDYLSPQDPNVISANALLQAWANQQESEAQRLGTPEAILIYTLDRSTIHFDAGFSDPDYLDEVANDWLSQDLQEAQDAGLDQVAAMIQAKMDEINAKISK